MEIVFKAKENSSIMEDIKVFMHRGRPVRSNYYGLDLSTTNEICILDNTIIVKQVHNGFCRLYFISFDENELIVSLNSLPKNVYVFNIPVRNELGTWTAFVDKLKFKQYSKYYRYINVKIHEGLELLKTIAGEDDIIEEKSIRLCEKATVKDIEGIYDLLYSTFDIYTDYLPNYEGLTKLIENDGVYVNKQPDGTISGTIIFVYTGRKCYQNFWIDKSELGLYLMRKLYERMEKDQITMTNLWVAEWNKAVIKLHKMLGAAPDNTIDYTYMLSNR